MSSLGPNDQPTPEAAATESALGSASPNRRLDPRDRLMPAVWIHIDRCNNAPNAAVRFAEHAQALGLLEAITILEAQ